MQNKSIQIKNIYYMLTYAFQTLRQNNYDEIAEEEFQNVKDLFSSILAKGVAQQIKQGLYKEYVTVNDNLSTLRGKIDINSTIKLKLQKKQRLACEFDELSENNIFNQIIKTTINLLLKQTEVKQKRKQELKKVVLFFDRVEEINISTIHWNTLKFQRNNQTYKMLLNICYFVLNGLIYTETKGKYKIANFLDDQKMSALFEKFILEYYKRQYKGKISVNASQIKWNYDEELSTAIEFLPQMRSDIMLQSKDKTLIIDAKFYSQSMQTGQFNKKTFHSHNMYQIFAYVKNCDIKGDGLVSGMLLYAKTDEEVTPNGEFMMSGNKISVKTLDLNLEFCEIEKTLNCIAKEIL